MPVRRQIAEPFGVYSVRFTCARWLHLFSITNGYHIVYNWFDYLKMQGHYIAGYVLMPNHVHAIDFSSEVLLHVEALRRIKAIY
jgi:hypothetical protein